MRADYEAKTEINAGHMIRFVIPKEYKDHDIRRASLIELIANSLDAKPSTIEINFDYQRGVLEVIDDGNGMSEESFYKEYHNITPSKTFGSGIGFAGQGAKLALNFCSKVLTETFSPSYKGYSEWHLEGEDAPYQIYSNQTLGLDHPGTKITLYLDDKSITYYTPELIEQILKEHYFPLLDEELLKAYMGKLPILIEGRGVSPTFTYRPIYKRGLKFFVNGKQIKQQPLQNILEEQKQIWVIIERKKRVKGLIGLARNEIEEDLQGVAICSFGKVIDRTWFKKEPREKQRIVGWIEAPPLIEAVTTDKCSFQRGNPIWEGFFRNAQAEFAKWLDEIGLAEKLLKRKADFPNLEKEINSILKSLPELELAAWGSKAQRDVAIPDEAGEQRELSEGTQKVDGTKGGRTKGGGVSVYPGNEPGQAPTEKSGLGTLATNHRRTIRGGIRLGQEENPSSEKEARFDGETAIINVSHPAYKRAEKSKLLDYHCVKSIALSLIEFSLERDPEPSYQKAFELSQRFFTLWGKQ
jgi:hypothetical protein